MLEEGVPRRGQSWAKVSAFTNRRQAGVAGAGKLEEAGRQVARRAGFAGGEGPGREVQSPWKAVGLNLLKLNKSLPREPGIPYWIRRQRCGCPSPQKTPPRMASAAAFRTAHTRNPSDIRRAHSKLGYVHPGGPTQQ